MDTLKELGKAFFIGILIFVVISIIEYSNGTFSFDGEDMLKDFGYNQLFSVVLYMSNMFYLKYLIKRFDQDFFSMRNFLIAIIGATFITCVSLLLLRFSSVVLIEGNSYDHFVESERLSYYYISFSISAVVITLFYIVHYYKLRQDTKFKEQRLIAGTASAKFDALKNQLDPHFLFNSLNVLTSLIEENPQAATKFTTSLSKVYRYVLEQKNKELVTLEEELKFAKLYMTLIRMRFEDSIVFTLPTVMQNPEAKVVPLSLQLVLENAVKHNQVTPNKKLYIEIKEENGMLRVVNNKQLKQVVKKSSGVGLRNIVERYKLLTDRPVMIQQNNSDFSIGLPLLTKENMTLVTSDTFISEKRYEYAKEQMENIKGFY
ncbi:MAG: sensor histidine kinase, partial [Flavobacteriaceae bacterium]|nr:sensor histidine kinase [Flavobacteriaceae bacterium]